MRRNWVVLLIALGVDNLGSGLFLPLTMVYVTRVVGLPLGVAGAAVTAGTVAGLLVPALVGPLVDRVGPRPVVVVSQVLQAVAALVYLTASGVASVVVGALLLAMGQQMFYSALFALIADVAGTGPKDRAFAVVGMVRSAAFGFGALAAGVLLAGGDTVLRWAIGVDGLTFVVAAGLAVLLRVSHQRPARDEPNGVGVLRNRPYLLLIGTTMLFSLAVDFFLIGVPVFVLDVLHGPNWLPGVLLALLTAMSALFGTAMLRLTRRWSRLGAMSLGAVLFATWCLISVAARWLPSAVQPGYLVGAVVVFGTGNLIFGPRANALAEAAAPVASRGRHLAAFQYAFTLAGVLAPAVVGLFSVSYWLPWLVVALACLTASVLLRPLATKLPASAVAVDQPPFRVR
ncbi:MFS transporter [Pseudonocardia spinosispora]|uniref:MFS transporter n=1 Tax=Pseudonocardia spinosispora TaxID=103441 RepID=UPI00048F6EA9|nr:MFS transporter [Pseudonocardia spinosispora]